jgi:hypothetical protein
MKPSEALRLARDNLMVSKDSWPFICNALYDLDTPSAREAEAHIEDLLFPYKTYNDWLKYNHPERYSKYEQTSGARLEARLLWIDDMIEYWESKGE